MPGSRRSSRSRSGGGGGGGRRGYYESVDPVYQNVEALAPVYQNVVSPTSAASAAASYNSSSSSPSYGDSYYDTVDGRRKEEEEEEEDEKQERSVLCCGKRRCTWGECCLWTRRIAIKLILFLVVKIVAIELLRKGIKSLDDCRAEDMIPIFLGVSSIDILLVCFLKLLKKLLKLPCWNSCVGSMDDVNRMYGSFYFIFVNIFQSLFSLGWLIAGSVWVFSVFEPNYDHPALPNYCRRDIYVFAFVFIVFSYLGILLVALLFVFRKVTGRRLSPGALLRRSRSRDSLEEGEAERVQEEEEEERRRRRSRRRRTEP